ncbi:MAG: hypothetical protein LBP59_10510 [Planctomycetaceae bacterium]|jgi:hypothetical protein|nr:hypothetical protein [Planctomycetaceae bacterium]
MKNEKFIKKPELEPGTKKLFAAIDKAVDRAVDKLIAKRVKEEAKAKNCKIKN